MCPLSAQTDDKVVDDVDVETVAHGRWIYQGVPEVRTA